MPAMKSPRYFISAVSEEFRTLRSLLAHKLLARGIDALPMEQMPTGHGDLTDALKAHIENCTGLIQLVGHRYGTPARGAAATGMSCTQFEYDHARELGLRVFVFVADENAAITRDDGATAPEPAGRAQAQLRYRDALLASDQICHAFRSDDELLRKLHEAFNELPELRREAAAAQRRARPLLPLAGLTLIGTALLLFAARDHIAQGLCSTAAFHSACRSHGWGGVPTAAQERLFADDARCGCAGLRRYINRSEAHPAFVARAQLSLAAQRSETESRWVPTRTMQYRDRIGFGVAELMPDEARARRSSLARLQKQATMLCEAYDAADDVRIPGGATPGTLDEITVNCAPLGAKVHCEAEATLYCDVEVRRTLSKAVCAIDGLALDDGCTGPAL